MRPIVPSSLGVNVPNSLDRDRIQYETRRVTTSLTPTDGESKKMPHLFLTAQSLSPRTPNGVQTRILLESFPEWKHLFWDAADFRVHDSRSTRIESLLFSRFSIFKRDPPPRLARALAGFSRWQKNTPKPALRRWLRTAVKNDVSAVFVSICSINDAERMQAILMELERPFVVHLWDMLDDDHMKSTAFRWLIESAAHVFCLTQEMVDHLSPARPDATILRFTRGPSRYVASAPAGGPLRIGLIGNCRPYLDGLSVLNEALRILKRRDYPFSVVYVGSKKRQKEWGERLEGDVEVTGFVESGDERDLLLSQCHVGFLPGPLAPPAINALSKFSIPSRTLDFMATGLPITGTVHPQSATATYLETHRLGSGLGTNTPELLAEKLIELSESSRWRVYAERSLQGFESAQQESRTLEFWLQNAAKIAQTV